MTSALATTFDPTPAPSATAVTTATTTTSSSATATSTALEAQRKFYAIAKKKSTNPLDILKEITQSPTETRDPSVIAGLAATSRASLSRMTESDPVEAYLNAIAELVEYQGFNPNKCWAVMISKCPLPELFPTLICAAVIVMSRGTKISFNSAAMQKTSMEGQALIIAVQNKLSIAPKPQRPETPTWSRVCSFMPHICATVLAGGVGRVIGAVPEGMAPWMAFPGGFVLCTTDEEKAQWIAWNVNFSDVIAPKEEHSNTVGIQRLWRFAAAKGGVNQLGLDLGKERAKIEAVASSGIQQNFSRMTSDASIALVNKVKAAKP